MHYCIYIYVSCKYFTVSYRALIIGCYGEEESVETFKLVSPWEIQEEIVVTLAVFSSTLSFSVCTYILAFNIDTMQNT